MNTPNRIISTMAAANFSLPARKKSFSAWVMIGLLLLTLATARADGPDDDYLAIYLVMNEADGLSADGKMSEAHTQYVQAQQALVQFQRRYPNWNVNIVSYRLNYLAEKADATSAHPVAQNASPAAVASVAEEAAPSVNAAAESTDDASVNKAVASAAEPLVTLLDPGSEPRSVLRLHPAAGDRQSMSMTMKIGMDMSAADKSTPAMDIPAIVMNLDVEVKSVAADGDITYAMVFNDATVAASANTMPAIAAAMKSSLAGINGMTGTGTMSGRGIVKNVEMKLPAAANPQLSQTIGQMKDSFSNSATPLPDEAVGAGARWEYRTRIKSQGMTIDQTLTYKLVSIEGDRLTLRSTITQNAANQKIQNPTMPTLKMNLTKMTGNGDGTTILDLGKVMPVSGTLDEKTEVIMGMNIGQRKQTMDMKMNINVAIESK